MNWTDQAEAMMKSLTEAQKKAWEGWYDLAHSGPNTTSFPLNMNDPMRFFKQGIEAWTAGSGSTGQGTAEQIFSGQRSMMRVVELLTQSWNIVAPNLESGKDWQGDLQNFTNQWVEQIMGVPNRLTESTQNTNELWQSFMGEWGPLMKPWLASLSQMSQGHLGEGMLGGSSGLNRLLSLETDGLSHFLNFEMGKELAFERMAEIPSVGSNREQNTKLLRAFDAFIDLNKVTVKYRATMAKAMGEAVKQTMEKLAELAKEGKNISSVRELNRLWLNIADEKFTDMYASAEYMELQRDLSCAGMKYKIQQRQVTEMMLESLNIPTRTELDDAYRSLYELRKEVKSLKKTLNAQKTTPRKAPVRRRRKTTSSGSEKPAE